MSFKIDLKLVQDIITPTSPFFLKPQAPSLLPTIVCVSLGGDINTAVTHCWWRKLCKSIQLSLVFSFIMHIILLTASHTLSLSLD